MCIFRKSAILFYSQLNLKTNLFANLNNCDWNIIWF